VSNWRRGQGIGGRTETPQSPHGRGPLAECLSAPRNENDPGAGAGRGRLFDVTYSAGGTGTPK